LNWKNILLNLILIIQLYSLKMESKYFGMHYFIFYFGIKDSFYMGINSANFFILKPPLDIILATPLDREISPWRLNFAKKKVKKSPQINRLTGRLTDRHTDCSPKICFLDSASSKTSRKHKIWTSKKCSERYTFSLLREESKIWG